MSIADCRLKKFTTRWRGFRNCGFGRIRGFWRCSLVSFALIALPLSAQQGAAIGADINALNATESFRIGLEAYNRYAFNEAILSLEQALSWRPGEGLILDWLGKAYYRSGLEETALRQWQAASRAYPPASPESVIINSRIEFVRNRRGIFPTMNDAARYVETGIFPGKYDNTLVFKQPTSVLSCDNGSVWAVAYGSNELVRLDVNGLVRVRRRGPQAGFDRPYDIIRGLDGRLYVSEFRGGRISVLSETGDWLAYIGSKGFGPGDLSGPAALACDAQGYIYVVEFGNRRISKFDPDGGFIHSFGLKDAFFPGFLSPTGITIKDDIIYAADSIAKKIYMFDNDGIFLGTAIERGLSAPESLKIFSDGSLLIADTNRLLVASPDSGIVRELTAPGNSRIRYTGADIDKNGAILAANFNENEIAVLATAGDVASGLFVQIERIVNDNFPVVGIEVSVQDARRQPVVGLDPRNFFLSERGYPVDAQQLLGVGDAVTETDITILIERSVEAAALRDDFAVALNDISAALTGSGGHIASIISAGTQPVRERYEAALPSTRDAAARAGQADPAWRFDLGLRLAATDLLPRAKKRAVVFLGTGMLGELAFESYALSELAAYLANNSIIFYCILSRGAEPDDALQYLCEQTGGKLIQLYQNEGVGPAIRSLARESSGVYTFSFRSALPTDFGRAFLPISAEVHLLDRSGRDDSGYFPPLE
ncbi:MAG: NHL repeat-containing protein [Spirochaetaceae bacterium]|jgi:DNA-binding beta-propeller fold protein YncE|nr:NHL repeat-containing protein [Spirochaetaceae bacterium]